MFIILQYAEVYFERAIAKCKAPEMGHNEPHKATLIILRSERKSEINSFNGYLLCFVESI